MNRYDKDMMHNRELIYDAKGQLHKADERYKKGDKGAKQEMIHDRELIHDAKREIHRIDVQKHEEHGYHASANKVHRKSRENRSNNYNPREEREALVEDNPVPDIEAGKAEGDYTS